MIPAGIFYYNIKDPIVDREDINGKKEEIEDLILRELRMNGLVNSDFEVIEHLDHQIEKSQM